MDVFFFFCTRRRTTVEIQFPNSSLPDRFPRFHLSQSHRAQPSTTDITSIVRSQSFEVRTVLHAWCTLATDNAIPSRGVPFMFQQCRGRIVGLSTARSIPNNELNKKSAAKTTIRARSYLTTHVDHMTRGSMRE